ncbi:MAG: hypothetical protein J5534_06940 [Fibrobacter sp.]|nr:hypothetical protein [Fibrobacter sp.]
MIMSVSFDVYGPFEVPYDRTPAKNGKKQYFEIPCKENLTPFWENCGMAEETGCYVFVNIVTSGSTPVYVGKTNNSFKNEIFASHKRVLLNKFLNTTSKKGLHVFFITTSSKADVEDIIGDIESYLIIQAKRANENLLNEKNTTPKWSISGIYGESKIGKPTMAARMLKKSLKL